MVGVVGGGRQCMRAVEVGEGPAVVQGHNRGGGPGGGWRGQLVGGEGQGSRDAKCGDRTGVADGIGAGVGPAVGAPQPVPAAEAGSRSRNGCRTPKRRGPGRWVADPAVGGGRARRVSDPK